MLSRKEATRSESFICSASSISSCRRLIWRRYSRFALSSRANSSVATFTGTSMSSEQCISREGFVSSRARSLNPLSPGRCTVFPSKPSAHTSPSFRNTECAGPGAAAVVTGCLPRMPILCMRSITRGMTL